jgi:peroxiredoxin
LAELKEFQKLVIENAKFVKGLSSGEKAPDFVLPNAVDKNVSLSNYLKKGPVVLKFYRGEWCPICNLDLRELQKIMPEIKSFGASLLAISPQNSDNALTMKEKNSLNFEVLSDKDQKVIKLYNLQFDPGEDYHKRRDLTVLNGDGSKFLPVPATFIINKNFIIEAAHVDPNYTVRMEPKTILDILKKITTKR